MCFSSMSSMVNRMKNNASGSGEQSTMIIWTLLLKLSGRTCEDSSRFVVNEVLLAGARLGGPWAGGLIG